MAPPSQSFDEELLSGYLDGTLSHRDLQRVRLYLESDPESRRVYEELRALRQTALSTRFLPPAAEEWPELPKTPGSRLSRNVGWMLLISWLLVIGGVSLWRFLARTNDPFEIFLVLGLPGAFALLFLSVLLDRLRSLKTDRYRDVHR